MPVWPRVNRGDAERGVAAGHRSGFHFLYSVAAGQFLVYEEGSIRHRVTAVLVVGGLREKQNNNDPRKQRGSTESMPCSEYNPDQTQAKSTRQ